MNDFDPTLVLQPKNDMLNIPEWKFLSGDDVAATPESVREQADLEAEEKRTLCSLNCLRYIYEGGDANYEGLTVVQGDSTRLSKEQFGELHTWFTNTLDSQEKLDTMQYIMVIHDIGKSGHIYEQMGVDPKSVDHDEILIDLLNDPAFAKQKEALLPTLSKLSAESQKTVAEVLGIGLNFGQFMQAEAPAAVLNAFPDDLNDIVKNMYLMHSILDIAGVVGHINPNSSVILTAPTYMAMGMAKDALLDSRLHGPKDRYNAYLQCRAEQFGISADDDVGQNVDDNAKVRLGCMLRCVSSDDFQPLGAAYDSIPTSSRFIMSNELARDGITDRATLPYYGPALLKALIGKNSMAASLEYFAYVLDKASDADQEARLNGENGVVTAELGDLTRGFNQGSLDIEHAPIKFYLNGNMLIPEIE